MKILAVAAAVLVLAQPLPSEAKGSEPSASEPIGTFRVMHDPAGDKVKVCAGVDGTYQDIRSRNRGTLTSTDPRLSGTVLTDERIVLNATALTGTVLGDIRILDDMSGDTKFEGRIIATVKGLAIRGVMTGTLVDGSLVVSNFSAYHDPKTQGEHAITGTLGSLGIVPADLSLIQSGRC